MLKKLNPSSQNNKKPENQLLTQAKYYKQNHYKNTKKTQQTALQMININKTLETLKIHLNIFKI
ncbi:hypothetical protein GCM10008015_02610 [Flavobacterium palustre]|uniref:Uncharacterized protein n=1 Tax=Flavobacterium palustre TaxID=1476463 RepID=A0ABQ1H8K3_9FLAO|nr:hypothetical protein GCM10008015_02610 [Flavobacterium palustre]